jgi:hypothetical protein
MIKSKHYNNMNTFSIIIRLSIKAPHNVISKILSSIEYLYKLQKRIFMRKNQI